MHTLFFDLDGTLTDSKPGITACIRHALHALGHKAPHGDELHWCVGPPLKASFAKLMGSSDPALLEQALLHYRERFSTVGLFENALYPGVLEALAELRGTGMRLFIVTAKPHVYARRIAEHFGLLEHFEEVHGSELDGTRGDKGELIAHVLARHALDPARVLMIGDREHDMRGAAQHGITGIGALWGYGGEAELRAHGARHLAGGMQEVPALVRRAFGL